MLSVSRTLPRNYQPIVLEPPARTHRITVTQYHRMIEHGILTEVHRVELLEGLMEDKMPQDPPHACSTDCAGEMLRSILPAPWCIRDQKPITLSDSEPEPDIGVVEGPPSRYSRRHPTAKETALISETADSSLALDQSRKQRIYARARIPVYWIINLVDRQVEVYTNPKAGKQPAYKDCTIYTESECVPVVIAGREVGRILVRDLLP